MQMWACEATTVKATSGSGLQIGRNPLCTWIHLVSMQEHRS